MDLSSGWMMRRVTNASTQGIQTPVLSEDLHLYISDTKNMKTYKCIYLDMDIWLSNENFKMKFVVKIINSKRKESTQFGQQKK